eukprot:Ihof_evm2s758 gene=Ihof_evmTU2s758
MTNTNIESDEVAELNDEIKEINNKIYNLNDENKRLKLKGIRLETQLATLQKEMKMIENSNQDEIDDLKDRHQRAIRELQLVIEAKDDQLEAGQVLYRRLLSDHDKLKITINEINMTNRKLKRGLIKETAFSKDIRANVSSQSLQSVGSHKDGMCSEINDLEENILQLQRSKRALESDLRDVKEQLEIEVAAKPQMEKRIHALTEDLKEKQEQQEEVEDENEALSNQVRSLTRDVIDLNSRLAVTLEDASVIEARKCTLEREVKDLREAVRQLESSRVPRSTNEILKLSLRNVQLEKEMLKKEIEKAEKRDKRQERLLSSQQADLDAAKQIEVKLGAEIRKNHVTLQGQIGETENISNQLDRYKTKLREIENELSNEKEANIFYKDVIKQLQNRNGSLKE